MVYRYSTIVFFIIFS